MTLTEGRKALTELVATTEDDELLKHYKELAQADDEKMKDFFSQSSFSI